jgi:hypothetical protein
VGARLEAVSNTALISSDQKRPILKVVEIGRQFDGWTELNCWKH